MDETLRDDFAHLDNEPDIHARPKDIAKYGMIPAVLLYNIRFWCKKNRDNEQNFRDGLYWTYNTRAAYLKQFPFFTEDQIRRALEKLVQMKAIRRGRYKQESKGNMTSTSWFAVIDGTVSQVNDADKLGKNPQLVGQKCPTHGRYHYTDNKQHITVLSFLNAKTNRNYQQVEANMKLIKGLLRKYPLDAIKRVIEAKVNEWIDNPKMTKYLRPTTLFRPSNFDAYINELPSEEMLKKKAEINNDILLIFKGEKGEALPERPRDYGESSDRENQDPL
jgi:uncharacterized phage protein (TIGR02220 family)